MKKLIDIFCETGLRLIVWILRYISENVCFLLFVYTNVNYAKFIEIHVITFGSGSEYGSCLSDPDPSTDLAFDPSTDPDRIFPVGPDPDRIFSIGSGSG